MHITEKLKNYIINSKEVCNSNIVITDLKNIQLVELLNKDYSYITAGSNLSQEILDLIKSWKSYNIDKSELLCIFNYQCLKIFRNDTNNYSSQMIFPLFNDNNLLGLIIFFRINGDYILSSAKSAKSLVKFTNEILNKENN